MTAPRPCLIPARKADIKWETPQAAVMSGLDYMAGEGYSAALATRQSESVRLVPFVERVREWWNAVPPQP